MLAVACGSPPAPASTAATPQPLLDSVSFERGACYGMCEIYQLLVRRSGDVMLRRRAAESNLALSVRDARQLLSLSADAGVLTLPVKIDADSALCPLKASDHSTFIITAYAGGATRRIDHYTGCYTSHDLRVAGPLERLVSLERRVNDLVVSK